MNSNSQDLWYKLTHIGSSSYIDDQRGRIKLVNFNTILLTGLFILTLSLSTKFFDTGWTLYDTIIYGGSFVLIGLFLYLNYLDLSHLSKVLTHIGFSLLFCIGSIASGKVFVCCLINMIWMVASLRILDTSRQKIILSGLQLLFVNITFYLITQIDYMDYVPQFVFAERCKEYSLLFVFLFLISKRTSDRIDNNREKIYSLLEELEEKNQKITDAYHEMESFSRKISHDLKTPLRNMTLFSRLLKKDISDRKEENIIEYLDYITTSGGKLTKMIDDVLAYSKLDGYRNEIFSKMSLAEIVDPIRVSMHQIYPNSKIILKHDGCIVNCKTKMNILFQNLIENGLKYNRSDERIVTIDFIQQSVFCTIIIEDNGIGIAEEYHHTIFDLFTRLHSDKEFYGTGIGLSTCKKIVESYMNGHLYVNSKSNKGSQFKVVIPQDFSEYKQ